MHKALNKKDPRSMIEGRWNRIHFPGYLMDWGEFVFLFTSFFCFSNCSLVALGILERIHPVWGTPFQAFRFVSLYILFPGSRCRTRRLVVYAYAKKLISRQAIKPRLLRGRHGFLLFGSDRGGADCKSVVAFCKVSWTFSPEGGLRKCCRGFRLH